MVSSEEHVQVLSEEMEVLESIYIEELESKHVVRVLTQNCRQHTCGSASCLRIMMI